MSPARVFEVVAAPALATPVPEIAPELAEFWTATTEGRFLVRRCAACGEAHWYPRMVCPFCHSTDTGWEDASGRGTVYTFSVVRRGAGDYAAAPYVLAYVELAEGPRMMTNIVDCDVESVRVGQEVEVVFHRASADAALPRFRPVTA
ncbi:Zn-ribbon domain-containing OB-fold protein [Actinomadura syzygii]|uniref:Zn-ribbon domain-containing OB-fold protein n=1 Tax=Actinomadura syzygii TaxID=1427538 RepID=A0A5D0U535_9ACTN|nr:Zn-ribbon domain-containing OB-fold protein [Actinomadura syzygii]TYC13177.1 Zn-ribbon domain-containing OB-fold protein [Actinomadura syzygii]